MSDQAPSGWRQRERSGLRRGRCEGWGSRSGNGVQGGDVGGGGRSCVGRRGEWGRLGRGLLCLDYFQSISSSAAILSLCMVLGEGRGKAKEGEDRMEGER